MSTSHVVGWGPNSPTPAQLKEFFDQITSGRITRERMQALLNEKEVSQLYLRHLETVTLAPTKGDATLAEAGDVFSGFIGRNFKDWGTNISGEDTDEVNVDVYEMVRDGNFRTLFGLLGDPRKLCLTQGQIVEFCRSHRDSLRQGGPATFFLFEAQGELFVVDVGVCNGELEVRMYCFDDDYVWYAEDRHRLVVEQQTV